MTAEEAVAMELVNIAMALTKAHRRIFNRRDLCDVLICRAIYVLNEQEPLVDYDADIITLLKSAGTDADAWVRAFKGEAS
jgi:hypothetical protein